MCEVNASRPTIFALPTDSALGDVAAFRIGPRSPILDSRAESIILQWPCGGEGVGPRGRVVSIDEILPRK